MMADKLTDIMSRSIMFENILFVRVLVWLVISVGYKIKGIDELEASASKMHCSDYAHYDSKF